MFSVELGSVFTFPGRVSGAQALSVAKAVSHLIFFIENVGSLKVILRLRQSPGFCSKV